MDKLTQKRFYKSNGALIDPSNDVYLESVIKREVEGN